MPEKPRAFRLPERDGHRFDERVPCRVRDRADARCRRVCPDYLYPVEIDEPVGEGVGERFGFKIGPWAISPLWDEIVLESGTVPLARRFGDLRAIRERNPLQMCSTREVEASREFAEGPRSGGWPWFWLLGLRAFLLCELVLIFETRSMNSMACRLRRGA